MIDPQPISELDSSITQVPGQVKPAVAEELVFRGLIGRGLVARWGLVPGILITSILFGVMHLHPVQAISVIPLGLAMHFAYFTTRTFWAPMTCTC